MVIDTKNKPDPPPTPPEPPLPPKPGIDIKVVIGVVCGIIGLGIVIGIIVVIVLRRKRFHEDVHFPLTSSKGVSYV